MKVFFGAVLCAILTAASTRALSTTESETLLMEANASFREANETAARNPESAKELYGKSILRFERILREAGLRNGRLYYNLGNAYFLGGDVGRAMLNYRRAELYIPNDPNLRQNLSYVRNQRKDRIEEQQKTKVLKTVFFWHYDLAAKTRMALFAAFFIALWVFASARLFMRRPILDWAIGLCVILSALLVGSLTVQAIAQTNDASGIILAKDTTARKGNGETYQPSFEEPLHAGTEFTLLEDRSGWYHIELHDGRRCWIPERAVELVREAHGG